MKTKHKYEPAYKVYDNRSHSVVIRDCATLALIAVILGAVCWLIMSLLALMATKDVPVVYWPVKILQFLGKWMTIIGIPIWIILELAGTVTAIGEKRRLSRKHSQGA